MSERSDPTPSVKQHDDSPFLFLADLLALDLVNTEIVVRGQPRDLLATPADVARWWAAAQRHYVEMAVVRGMHNVCLDDPDVLDKLTRLRAALRNIFGALVDGVVPTTHAVAYLNAVLRSGHHAIEVTSSGDLQPVYQTSDQASGALLLPIALSAVAWRTTSDLHRLHRCANMRCVLLFYDTTKSATRRWCSLGCMDRARSAQRYQQAKQRSEAQQ